MGKEGIPRVSVVVPTAGRTELLARCLAALLDQDLPCHLYEVVIVADGSHPKTEARVRHLSQSRKPCPTVHYLPTGVSTGPAAARNKGWRHARGALIAFTDDDCVPQRSWLSSGLKAIDATPLPMDARGTGVARPSMAANSTETDILAGVSGRIFVPLPRPPTDYQKDIAGLEGAEFVTANCFYWRDVLESLGGFDERFTQAWREDADLYLSLVERGCRLACAPKAVVIHPVRGASWGASVPGQRKHRFNALLYKKHPKLYWQRIQPSPPWNYYWTVGALFGTLAALLTPRKKLWPAFLGVWSMLTICFALRRLHGTSHHPSHVADMLLTSIVIPPLAVFWRLHGAMHFRVWFL